MTIFYSRHPEKPDFSVPFHKIRATEGYLRHYDNYLVLTFIQQSTQDRREKQDATAELDICERKLKWMQHHPNFVQAEADKGIEELKRMWRNR